MSSDLKTEQELAEELIEVIDRSLPKWRTWFPDDSSMVEVPRNELLAMKAFAEIGLRKDAEAPDTLARHVLCCVANFDDGTMSVMPLYRGTLKECEELVTRIVLSVPTEKEFDEEMARREQQEETKENQNEQ